MDLCFLVTVFILTFIRHSDGLHCFNCANITEEVDCNAVLQCKSDESCYIERTEQGGHTIYSLGCIADQDCPIEHQFSIIGRSTNGHCQKCCHQNGCNKKYCDAQILAVPQTTTGSCADGPGQNCSALASVVNICSHPHQAKDVCRKYCGLCDMVDGGWSQWLGWSSCSTTCGLGITTRTRQCTAPAPAHGGYMCSGNSTQQRSCFDRDCPVHGEWGLWDQWESCSVSCGSGLRKRHRHCTNPPPSLYGHYCIGDGVEYSLCQETDCRIQTTSMITAPTVSHCDDLLTECSIANTSFGICNNFEAAKKSCAKFCGLCGIVDGSWSAWSLWSSCSVTCDQGSATRTRSCSNPPPLNGGKNCTGNNTESKSCKLRQCPVHGDWSTWAQWESCSSTCGQGITHRNRFCDNPRPDLLGNFCFGDSTQYGLCLIKPCPVNGGWTEWSLWASCSVSCGHGRKTRQRLCLNPRPTNGGLACVGSPIEQTICNMTACPGIKSAFTVWNAVEGPTTGTLKFTSVITNIGGHYSTSTGKFSCQYPGIYVFVFQILRNYTGSSYLSCHIRKNGSNKVQSEINAKADIGAFGSSNTVVLHLYRGDVVDVGSCLNPSGIYPGTQTSFSGFLLKAD